MPSKFNIFQSGLSLREAVDLILATRKLARPFDLRMESTQVSFSNDALIVDGSSYDITDMGLAPLCAYLDLDSKLLGRLSKTTGELVIMELMKKRAGKIFIRAGAEGSTNYVRTVLKSKFNVMDDRVLFGRVLDKAKQDKWNHIVDGAWVSDVGSAIRVCLSDLPESSAKFGMSLHYGFDVANSELVPQSSWVKGVIMGDGFAVVSPKVLGSKNTSDLAELMTWLDQFVAAPASKIDALVSAGLPTQEVKHEEELDSLVKKHLLNKTERQKVFDGLKGLETVTGIDLIRAVGKYAANLDYYHKRSSIEYISNMWCRGVKRR